MYSFDGEYRRRPVQNLGGSSQTFDRETIIRKAQLEREKRSELRRQQHGAIVMQSYTRSFVHRQRQKRLQRELFDDYLKRHRERLLDDEHLACLLCKLLFFYNCKEKRDADRLIELCQQILRNPARLIQNSALEFIWLHRLRKLLNTCIIQLTVPHAAQAIPLRMLETFSSESSVERFVENETLLLSYLERIFAYLIAHDYFARMRLLLEQKCPVLDKPTTQAPNAGTEALLQMLLRPLLIAQRITQSSAQAMLNAFTRQVLALCYSDAMQKYVIPCLAAQSDFPLALLLQVLQAQLKINTMQHMQMDVDDYESGAQFTGASAATAAKSQPEQLCFTGYLLNALLKLDCNQMDKLNNASLFEAYLQVLAAVSTRFLQLPKSSLKLTTTHHQRSMEAESSDSEDDSTVTYSNSRTVDSLAASAQLSGTETAALIESIELLNESARVNAIVGKEQLIQMTPNLYAICELCHNLMVYNKSAVFEYKLLYTLAFMPSFLRAVWFTLSDETTRLGFSAPLTLISKGVEPKNIENGNTISLLATFCNLFGRLLPTLHDTEFCEDNAMAAMLAKPKQTAHHNTTVQMRLMPFYNMAEIVQLSKKLRDISMGLVDLAFPETRSSFKDQYRSVLGRSELDECKHKQQTLIWSNLLKVVVYVLNQLHTRDLRLNFCPESHWTVNRLDLPLDRPTDLPLTRGSRTRGIRPFQPIRDFTREHFEEGPPMSTKQIRSITILREIPFVVPFSKRVGILQALVTTDKMRVQGQFQAFLQGPSIMLTVRRTHLYEDAFDKLREENEPDLRLKFRVQFVSYLGLDEAGIDGGGVFREFLSELIKTAFDPNRGFFLVTTDNKLYPNPNVGDLIADFEKHYKFIGRILGKAIYENLLVELPLAEFFLTKLAGKYADVDIHQLASLDPELYKNMVYLKDYEGDVSELNLDFTVASNALGQTQLTELKPNGQNIAVTNSNRIEYLQLMADYKLNVQIRQHCVAFRKGLSNVLPVEWLYMFSNKELQILISGAEIPIDLEDLKKHCKYGGEYSPEHPSIKVFWSTVQKFNDLQRRQLLKFVTSCSRPPLLGFKDLDPPFFIQNAGDMERLPTASTCTNLLKLPPFKTEEKMREKLLYAIQAGEGFELS